MEYVAGRSLAETIGKKGLPLDRTLKLGTQIADALAKAHAKGIVHRDLKPANIYLLDVHGERDFVKLLDFGVSKARASTARLTDGSTFIGTPSYMSREQAQGLAAEADARTDQWALACIAWEALSGRPPFVADDNLAILYRVVHEEPPPLLRHDLPAEVEEVLRRALAKERRHRFSTVNRFAEALEHATSTAPRSGWRAPWLAAAALAAGWLLFSSTVPLLTATAKEPGSTRPSPVMTSASAKNEGARMAPGIEIQPLRSLYTSAAARGEQASARTGAGTHPAILSGTDSFSLAVTRPPLALPGQAGLTSSSSALDRRAASDTTGRQTHHGRVGLLRPPEPQHERVREPSHGSRSRHLRGGRRLLRVL
jgi:serine/threonine protein kinase